MPTTQRRIAQQQRAQQTTISSGTGYQQNISLLQTMRTNFNQQIDNLILSAPQLWGSVSTSGGTANTAASPAATQSRRPVSASTRRKLSKIMRERAAQQKAGTTQAVGKGRAAAA
jgi:hypothetical protein